MSSRRREIPAPDPAPIRGEWIVWRDSVCAGDDCDAPHEMALIARDETLRDLVTRIANASYLASISGGRATWILQVGKQKGPSLAVLAQQWSQPRFLVNPEAAVSVYIANTAAPHLYFRYWCQADPNQVFACLQQGKPLPDPYGR